MAGKKFRYRKNTSSTWVEAETGTDGQVQLEGVGFADSVEVQPIGSVIVLDPVAPPTLATLTLSRTSIPSNLTEGEVAAAVQNITAGSSVIMTNTGGGLFAYQSGYIVRTAAAYDPGNPGPHTIALEETLTGATGSPKTTSIALTFTDVVQPVTLNALTLSFSSVSESAAPGAVVGAVQGQTPGSTVTMFDNAGARFAYASGSGNVVTGLTALDYEDATSHGIILRETHPDAAEPRDTSLTINVTNTAEVTLAALTLSAAAISEGAANGTVVGQVQGATPGSTLSLFNTAGGRFSLAGGYINKAAALDYETNTSHDVIVRETHPDAATHRDTPFTLTVSNVLEVTLAPLTLSAATVAEGAAEGVVVGTVQGKSADSALALTGTAGDRFKLIGTTIYTGPTATSYASATSHDITLIETHPDAVNSPSPTTRTVNVTQGAGVVIPAAASHYRGAEYADGTLPDKAGTNTLTVSGTGASVVDGRLALDGKTKMRMANPTGLPAGSETVTLTWAGVPYQGPDSVTAGWGYGTGASGQMFQLAWRRRRYVVHGWGVTGDTMVDRLAILPGQPVVIICESNATGCKTWVNGILMTESPKVLNKTAAHLLLGGTPTTDPQFSSVPQEMHDCRIIPGALTPEQRQALTDQLLGEMPQVAVTALDVSSETWAFDSASGVQAILPMIGGAVGMAKITYPSNTSDLITPPVSSADYATVRAAMEAADGALAIHVSDALGRTASGTLTIQNGILRPTLKDTYPAIEAVLGSEYYLPLTSYFEPADEGGILSVDLANSAASGGGVLALSESGAALLYTPGGLGEQTLTLRVTDLTTGNYRTIVLPATVRPFEPAIQGVEVGANGLPYAKFDAGNVGILSIGTEFTRKGAPVVTSSSVDLATVPGAIPILHHPGGYDGGLTAGSTLTAFPAMAVSDTLPATSGRWLDAAAGDAPLQDVDVYEHVRASGQNPEFEHTITNAVGSLNRRITTGLTLAWTGEPTVTPGGLGLWRGPGALPDATRVVMAGTFVQGATDGSAQLLYQTGYASAFGANATRPMRLFLNSGNRLLLQFVDENHSAYLQASSSSAYGMEPGERAAFVAIVSFNGETLVDLYMYVEQLTPLNVRDAYTLSSTGKPRRTLPFANYETFAFVDGAMSRTFTGSLGFIGLWLDPTFDTSSPAAIKDMLFDLTTPLANGQTGALANGTLKMKDPALWMPTLGQPADFIKGPASDLNAGLNSGSAPNFPFHEPDNATNV